MEQGRIREIFLLPARSARPVSPSGGISRMECVASYGPRRDASQRSTNVVPFCRQITEMLDDQTQ